MAPLRIEDARRRAWKQLEAAGNPSAALDARLLLRHVLGIDDAQFISRQNDPFDPHLQARFNALVARRAAGEPVAYLTGNQEFWSLPFTVSSETLIPRPDSETLIEAVLAARPDQDRPLRIMDLGTGSGCLLVSLLREYPRAWGLGVDRSKAALDVARGNADMLGVGERTAWLQADWLSACSGSFDIVVANPPYIARDDLGGLAASVRDWEPHAALDGGPDGLAAYRAVLTMLPERLAPGGFAVLEAGWDQQAALDVLIRQTGVFGAPDWSTDMAGHARSVRLSRAVEDPGKA